MYNNIVLATFSLTNKDPKTLCLYIGVVALIWALCQYLKMPEIVLTALKIIFAVLVIATGIDLLFKLFG